MLVRLNFQEDVVPRLLFLKDVGVQDFQLGPMLTKNPFLLTESLENMQTRSELNACLLFLNYFNHSSVRLPDGSFLSFMIHSCVLLILL